MNPFSLSVEELEKSTRCTPSHYRAECESPAGGHTGLIYPRLSC
jgi:hypothetical protein